MRNLLLLDRCTDRGQHSLYIVQHVIVPKTKHTIPLSVKIGRSRQVARGLSRFGMLAAIDLNDETQVVLCEIREVGSDRGLAPPVRTGFWQTPQVPSKFSVGVRNSASQRPGARNAHISLPNFSLR